MMKNWFRIVLLMFVLIGGTMSFGFWSVRQFDNVFENLSASYVATLPPVREPPTIVTDLVDLSQATTTVTATSTTSNDIDSKFQLIFSPEKNAVYIGCTYEISWFASTTIKSLETALIDVGTQKPASPIASGLAIENNIEAGLQNLKWKVGVVRSGEYFISVSNIDGVAINKISQEFIINEMPSGTDEIGQKNLCKETGGGLF